MKIRRIQKWDWELVEVHNAALSLLFLPQIGGRLIGCEYRGKEIFFQHPKLLGRVGSQGTFLNELGDAFALWGGEKTWLAPQSSWVGKIPFQTLDSGAYELEIYEASGVCEVVMKSQICEHSGIQIMRRFHIQNKLSSWSVEHEIKRINETSMDKLAIWTVSMIRRPARILMPVSKDSEHVDGVRIFEHEGHSSRYAKQVIEKCEHVVIVDASKDLEYKYGTDVSRAWIAAEIQSSPKSFVLMKSFDSLQSKPYPDGCTVEVYNSAKYPYFEMELLCTLV
ncbi:MAG: hypothetical protein KDD52_07220, partial [Bdellovibrionales bacterium]|nr:hypothetical protein [Bdellovibrionales bacterium]